MRSRTLTKTLIASSVDVSASRSGSCEHIGHYSSRVKNLKFSSDSEIEGAIIHKRAETSFRTQISGFGSTVEEYALSSLLLQGLGSRGQGNLRDDRFEGSKLFRANVSSQLYLTSISISGETPPRSFHASNLCDLTRKASESLRFAWLAPESSEVIRETTQMPLYAGFDSPQSASEIHSMSQ